MIKKQILAFLLILSISVLRGNAQPLFSFLVKNISTGVIDNTNPTSMVSYGSNDDDWKVKKPTEIGYNQAKVCQNLNNSWAVNACGRWITDNVDASNQPANVGDTGVYEFKMNFNYSTSPYEADSFYFLFNYLGADDRLIEITINGNVIYNKVLKFYPAQNFNPLLVDNSKFWIPKSYVWIGANTLKFKVRNTGGMYKGLFVCGGLYGVVPAATITN